MYVTVIVGMGVGVSVYVIIGVYVGYGVRLMFAWTGEHSATTSIIPKINPPQNTISIAACQSCFLVIVIIVIISVLSRRERVRTVFLKYQRRNPANHHS